MRCMIGFCPVAVGCITIIFWAKKVAPTTLTMIPISPKSILESIFIVIDVIWLAKYIP